MLLHNIKRLCEKKQISLNQLEKEAEIGINTIYRWNDSPPSIQKVQKVASILGVSIDYLLEDHDGQP